MAKPLVVGVVISLNTPTAGGFVGSVSFQYGVSARTEGSEGAPRKAGCSIECSGCRTSADASYPPGSVKPKHGLAPLGDLWLLPSLECDGAVSAGVDASTTFRFVKPLVRTGASWRSRI